MLRNSTRNITIAENPFIAETFFSRAFGMIGKRFGSFDAFILPRCRSVHTWFMGYALDLIFINAEKSVLRVDQNIKPWRMIVGPASATTVIELPAGHLCGIPIDRNDILAW